jgi:thiol-disulfide isomerase/thioredoxin
MKKSVLLLVLFTSSVLAVSAQQLPEFSIKDIENNFRTFEELKGEQLTLFDFWTTWCKPCRKAIPQLNEIYSEYRDKGVEVVGVNCDGPRSSAKVAPMARSLNIQYPVLMDINSDLMNDLNLANFPALIAVNPKGKVVFVHEGFALGDEVEIREAIDVLLHQ